MTDKQKHPQPIKHEKRHHRWILAPLTSARSAMIAVVLMSAGLGGIYTILNSSAANVATTGRVVVYVVNSDCPNLSSGCQRFITNAAVSVVAHHEPDGNYGTRWDSSNTCSLGGGSNTANAQNYTGAYYDLGQCYVWLTHNNKYQNFHYYILSYAAAVGWHPVGGVGSTAVLHSNGTATFTVSMQNNDHDGDGVAWPNDACNDTAGKGDSKAGAGCPYPSGCGAGTLNNTCVVTLPSGCGANTKNDQCPPPNTGGSGSGGGSTVVKSASTASRTVARAPAVSTTPAVTANTDKQAPTAPESLSATESTSGSIDLSWMASTDDTAVTGYLIERSDDDGQTWNVLNENATDTSYIDDTTEFSAKYSYRVSAKDAAGNASDYVISDITTSSFSPNAYVDEETIIESDDGIVSVKIPAGALEEDAACEVNQSNDKSLSKSRNVLSGTYELICKSADGSQVDKFNKPVEFKLTVNKKLLKDKPQLYTFSDGKWVNSKLKLDKNHSFNFSTDSPKPFAVVSTGGGLVWWKILLGLFLLIGAIYGVFAWWRKRKQLSSYYDSLNAQYAMPTPPVGMAAPVVGAPEPLYPATPSPLPQQQPLPPIPDQQIGHRTIFSPAIGGNSAAQQPPPAVGGINDPFNEPPHNSQQQPPQNPPQQ